MERVDGGGVGGHQGRCVPPEGGRWPPGAGGAAPPASWGTFTARSAQTTGREAPYRCGAGLPRAAGGGASWLFLPATPWPPGEVRPAEKRGGVAAAATRVAGPGKQRGDVCGRKSGNRAPVGAGRARCALARPIVRGAHGHTRWTRNERILPPLISPPIAPQQSPVAPGGCLMG